MKRIAVLAFSVWMACTGSAVFADTAGNRHLAAMVQTFGQMPAVTCGFTLEEDGNKINGEVISSGPCFIISAGDGAYQSWFDGKTQWTWNDATGEVNMSQPTADELLETNPFAIISAIGDNYNATVVKSDASSVTLRLLPKDSKKGNIKEAEVLLNTKTNIPASLSVKLKDGQTVNISFTGVKAAAKIPQKEFRYKESYHPGAEIIDLR